MGRSKKFLKDTSEAARSSNKTAFEKIKNLFTMSDEEKEKQKRKELIEKERKRAYKEIKPREY